MVHVAVVGAGITGLTAARRLLADGFEVTLFERWPDVGGMASAFDVGGGIYVDRYYHHLFESDHEMIKMHADLLPGELEWHRSSVGIFTDGRIWRFVSPIDLLRYEPVPLQGRVRLGLTVLWLQRQRRWDWMDDVPAVVWLRKMCGPQAMDHVWRPLLLGKFGEHAERVPLAWLWSKLVLRRRLGKGRAGAEFLGYPRSSFRAIIVALANDIQRRGGAIQLDREVVHVDQVDSRYVLHCAAPGAYRRGILASPAEPAFKSEADAVLFTTPTFVTRALANWSERMLTQLDDWQYRTAVVLLLELRRALTTTYWLNVADPAVHALGIIEHTNLVPPERYPARYLYVSNYVDERDPLASMSTDELLIHHTRGLRRISPSFKADDVLRAWSFREPAAQPIPRLGNRARILPIATSHPGLFIANTTQIYPEDRGTNYSVRLGQQAAAEIKKAVPVAM